MFVKDLLSLYKQKVRVTPQVQLFFNLKNAGSRHLCFKGNSDVEKELLDS